MDSRTKIGKPVPPGATVIRGYFDPLLASHAARLAACPRPLAVVVEDPPQPLLPRAARQLLVAALTTVDAVLDAPPETITEDWTAADLDRRRDFIEHVHARART